MRRRRFLQAVAAGAGMSALGVSWGSEEEMTQAAKGFNVRGVYFHDGFTVEPKSHAPLYWGEAEWRRQMTWLRACGINTVEFATMLEFNRVPSTDLEKKKIADRQRILKLVHEFGMRFGYILTNTVMSTVPEGEAPGHQLLDRAKNYCPQEPGNFEKTTALQKWYMDAYKEADFFEQFAADWGGCTCGRCGVKEYLRYVTAFAEKLAEMNPKARITANTWCIGFWGGDPMAQGWRGMFDREIAASREVIAALPSLPENVDLALPCHHLYRPLAYSEYGGKAATPVFPTREDVEAVHKTGRQVLAWPHFVMDDDAFRPAAWGIVHLEVRYIQGLLRALRDAGIDSVMGNLYLPFLQLPNTYAYGRLLEDPDADPAAVIRDFAALVAHPDDAAALAEVLTWMENASYWQEQMPPDGRLPQMACEIGGGEVKARAAAIRPNPAPAHPLPVEPAAWLADVVRSIDRMTWAFAAPVGA